MGVWWTGTTVYIIKDFHKWKKEAIHLSGTFPTGFYCLYLYLCHSLPGISSGLKSEKFRKLKLILVDGMGRLVGGGGGEGG